MILIIACNQKEQGQSQLSIDQNPNSEIVEIPDDFPAFYSRFHMDPEFQLSRIVFPLQGKTEDSKWDKASWEIHKPYHDSEEFKRSFSNFANIIAETIQDTKGMFYLERRFSKISGEWHLIYYTQGTTLEGFEEENQ